MSAAAVGLLWCTVALAAPPRLALIVGIDSYPDPAIHDLSGAVNDAKLWAATLKHRFGFTEAELRLLVNGQATRAGIERAFREHLIAKAGQGTAAVFVYSGHGSRQANAAEADGYDETIVPCDSGRRARPNLDITDDELNRWIAELARKTPNITVIRDSCHAGGSMRATARLAPEGEPADDVHVAVRAPVVRYVSVAAARNDQLAHERYFEGRRHGQLTWHLSRALLDTAGESVSWGDLMDRVSPHLDVERSPTRQTPQLEGAGMDRKPFQLDLLPRRRGFPVHVTADGVRIDAGSLLGFAEGTEFEVLPPRGGAPAERAVVRLTEVGPTLSMGRLSEGGPVRPGSRAFELRRTVRAFQATVHVPSGRRYAALRDQIKALPPLRLVSDPADAELAVEPDAEGVRLRSPDPYDTRRYALATPAPIVEALHWWARWLHLKRLRAPARGPRIGFERAVDRSDRAQLKDGTEFTLAIVNRHDAPLYLWVLNLAPDGTINPLYPLNGAQEALAPKGRVSFPAVAEIDGERPVSRESVVVLATTRYTDFSFLHSPPGLRTRAVYKDPLQALLARTVHTRSVTPVAPLPAVGWNIARWHLEIVPR